MANIKQFEFQKFTFCEEGKSFVLSHLRSCEGCRKGLSAIVEVFLKENPREVVNAETQNK
jgi:hypothetical protein